MLRQNSGTAPSTGIHLRNNVTQARRILLILKSAELLANDNRSRGNKQVDDPRGDTDAYNSYRFDFTVARLQFP